MRALAVALLLALAAPAHAARPGPSPGQAMCSLLTTQAIYFAVARDLGAPKAAATRRIEELMATAPAADKAWVMFALDFVFADPKPADPFERVSEFAQACLTPGV